MHRFPLDPQLEDLKKRLYLRAPELFRTLDPPSSLLRAVLAYESQIAAVTGEREIVSLFDDFTPTLLTVRDELQSLLEKELYALDAGLYRAKAIIEDYRNEENFVLLRQGLLLAPTGKDLAAITEKTAEMVAAIKALPIRISEIPLQIATHPLSRLRVSLAGLETAVMLSRFDDSDAVRQRAAEIHALLSDAEALEARIGDLYSDNRAFLVRFFPAYQRTVLPLLNADLTDAPSVRCRMDMIRLEKAAKALRVRLYTLLKLQLEEEDDLDEDEMTEILPDDRKANEP